MYKVRSSLHTDSGRVTLCFIIGSFFIKTFHAESLISSIAELRTSAYTQIQMASKQTSKRLPQRKLKAITTRLPEPTIKRLGYLAVERGTTLQSLITEAVLRLLAGNTQQEAV